HLARSANRRLRARRERPHCRRSAEQRYELAPFHQQFLPCFEAEDSTAGDLLHCGISKEPLSAYGSEVTETIGAAWQRMSASAPILLQKSFCTGDQKFSGL